MTCVTFLKVKSGANSTFNSPLSTFKTNKKKDVVAALAKYHGIVSDSCKEARISRETFYKWLHKDKKFAAEVEAVLDEALDFVESKMFQSIEAGDVRMIIFYLETKGKKRGYTKKVELAHQGNVQIVISPEEAEY